LVLPPQQNGDCHFFFFLKRHLELGAFPPPPRLVRCIDLSSHLTRVGVEYLDHGHLLPTPFSKRPSFLSFPSRLPFRTGLLLIPTDWNSLSLEDPISNPVVVFADSIPPPLEAPDKVFLTISRRCRVYNSFFFPVIKPKILSMDFPRKFHFFLLFPFHLQMAKALDIDFAGPCFPPPLFQNPLIIISGRAQRKALAHFSLIPSYSRRPFTCTVPASSHAHHAVLLCKRSQASLVFSLPFHLQLSPVGSSS